jgi:hypothetical protein
MGASPATARSHKIKRVRRFRSFALPDSGAPVRDCCGEPAAGSDPPCQFAKRVFGRRSRIRGVRGEAEPRAVKIGSEPSLVAETIASKAANSAVVLVAQVAASHTVTAMPGVVGEAARRRHVDQHLSSAAPRRASDLERSSGGVRGREERYRSVARGTSILRGVHVSRWSEIEGRAARPRWGDHGRARRQ